MTQEISFHLNGKQHQVSVNPVKRLSDVLREDINCTATKVGCNAGDCGSCTVLIDGEIACSCLTSAAQIEGSSIETLEGFSEDNTLSNLQNSFIKHGAAQCGICTPGMLISARSLLEKNPSPSKREVEDALGGVLCRCTGYRKIVQAVMHANDTVEDEILPNAGQSVGAAIRHLDGVPKVDGSLAYSADTIPENALYVRVIRNPHHHADFTIRSKEAFVSSNKGIEAFLDASDVPGRNSFGVIPQFEDQPVFADGTSIYRGEAVAAVVGEFEIVDALKEEDFPIEWYPKDHTFNPQDAKSGKLDDLHKDKPENFLIRGYVEKGSVDTALAKSMHMVEVKTSTPFIEHAYIELEAGYCIPKNGRLELFGATQAAQMDRESLAEILNLGLDKIRVMPSACGGGFGSKLDLSFQPYVALAALKLNRPAYIRYNRGDSMRSTTKRHPSDITLKVGCDENGMISGLDFDGTFNTGAYASWGPTVANRVPVHASGPYFMDNYRARSVAVYTNSPPSGAFRGFGVPQSAVAQEVAFDKLADKAGIDRLEFRLKNALKNGMPTTTGQVFEKGVGIQTCLETIKPYWEAARKNAKEHNRSANGSGVRKGVGIGTCWYGCGNTSLPNPSTVRMGVQPDGTVVLHQGAMDIGQGANTVITQIAADSLGIPVHSIKLVNGDTDLSPDCGKTSASRQTYVSGKAAQLSGYALRKEILRNANVSDDANLLFDVGNITVQQDSTTTSIDLSMLPVNEFGYVFMAEETYDPPTKPLDEKGQGIPYAVYGYGAQMMELTVDTGLGTVKLDRIVTAHDVGKAINPMLVEGQIEGGVAQGIGMALMEDYVPGKTENLHDYLIPTFGDMPEFEHIIVEVEDAEGPFGAKGLGEHVLIPTAPAIINAIRDATGAEVYDLPATPDKVLAALKTMQKGQ
ncbi:MAG: molybdopterin-dependent oxidoreductase [Rhizobiaceae bacterium]|nr:molybdopterin-dependent oxidoreductase [Rhizobiaceae bacterium]